MNNLNSVISVIKIIVQDVYGEFPTISHTYVMKSSSYVCRRLSDRVGYNCILCIYFVPSKCARSEFHTRVCLIVYFSMADLTFISLFHCRFCHVDHLFVFVEWTTKLELSGYVLYQLFSTSHVHT